ncbi:MAG TPA: YraN family protein [Bordetella sp.]|nr:YraN family protein [Bordetella sp.]
MHDPFPEIAYEHARQAQQRMLKRRRAAARRTARQSAEPATPRASPTQQAGASYETRALRLLAGAGLVPLARNLHCRAGEIDLVMRDGDTLVFVEVRARASGRYGGAAASVGRAKQARLLRSATLLLPGLARRHWGGRIPPVRFDVVAFEAGSAHWLPAAFCQ